MDRTVFAALLLVAPLSGCSGLDMVDPVWEIPPEDHLVVMPFKDPDFNDRWDSPRGHEIAQRTTEIMQRECEFGVRPYDEIYALYHAEDVNKLSPRDVAALCRADYVLVCDIEHFELMDPKSVNIRQGTARVKVRLFQVQRRTPEEEARAQQRNKERDEARRLAGMEPLVYDRGGEFLAKAERVVEVRFPSDFTHPGGDPFLAPDEVERGLIMSTARKVAKLYYTHPQEKIDRD